MGSERTVTGPPAIRAAWPRMARSLLAAAVVMSAAAAPAVAAGADDTVRAEPTVTERWMHVPDRGGDASPAGRWHLRIVQPDQDPHPVLLVAETLPQAYWNQWADRGYTVVHLSLPGYGQSDGCTDLG